jgi:hypothetical protein
MANPEPESLTGKMKAARRHRSRAYAERNELIAWMARMYESHLMPASGGLKTLSTRAVVCIHSPAGLLCWVVTQEEVDDYFKPMKWIDSNHWDKSTRGERSRRLAEITALTPAEAVATKPAKGKAKRKPRLAARRPGDFSRPRRAINR